MHLCGTLVRRKGFSWGYEVPNKVFYWNSTWTAKFLKVFLSLSDKHVICQISNQKQLLRGVLWKKVLLEISNNSQESSSARVSFWKKLQTEACNFIKKETLIQVFSCKFCEHLFLQNISGGCFCQQDLSKCKMIFAFGIWLKQFC